MRHSIATLYLAGPVYANDLAKNISRRGFEAFTITAGLGVWQGMTEPAFVVTIIGETAAPAHLAVKGTAAEGDKEAVLMPADETAFQDRIRTLAENLANDYKQECVAFAICGALFELTTAQAGYRRHG
jgi:hypothetical protein